MSPIMGFTHIELLPITEHPLDDLSWGYQPTGLFAPTSRFGDARRLRALRRSRPRAGLGVILDWVPAHFPTDAHGLARFDGTALYEHADPRRAFIPTGTPRSTISAAARSRTSSSTTRSTGSSAIHIDGLRVDAVASMLYLDYSRKRASGCPTKRAATRISRRSSSCAAINDAVYGGHPGSITIAEESTAWPGVSQPADAGGLGFGFKWNMGFMHDTLDYMARDPIHRRYHHDEMTFGLLYAFTENFVLPLSHDEVVHGKGSLLGKMPGDDWQKFANARAYLRLHVGLSGQEAAVHGPGIRPAQRMERRRVRSTGGCSTRWPHAGVAGAGPRPQPALPRDARPARARLRGRRLRLDRRRRRRQFGASPGCAAARRATRPVAVISNFTPVPRDGYRVLGLPLRRRWREVINTDAGPVWRASNIGNFGGGHGRSAIVARLPGLGDVDAAAAGDPVSSFSVRLSLTTELSHA